MGIEIRGGDAFKAKLQELVNFYPEVLDLALDDTADAISLDAQRMVPVDTGRLRASINVKRDYLTKVIGTNVEYAPHVEYRTQVQQPQQYLRPSFEKNKKRVAEFFKANL